MIRPLLLTLIATVPLQAQSALPRVQEAAWPPVREQCRKLLAALRKTPGAIPADAEKRLTALLREDVKDADTALERLQDILDPLCLAGVHINPESRVKAERGPLPAGLTTNTPRFVLVKIRNEGGITAPLALEGDELRLPGKTGAGRWLEATLIAPKPLTGLKLEYVVLRLTAREAGKREATLKFDAGQGTQDLGFRAEVPVLFRVRKKMMNDE
jgi:hypothetical protein